MTANPVKSESALRHRADIDGLRAVAVAAVVLYHARLFPVPGGFVGVDVFFVISGYLITTIVLEDIRKGRFSIGHFYERRVRRILPALSAVLIVSSIAAWRLLLPHAARDYGLSLIATVFFWSNQLFVSTIDYFHPLNGDEPLLHTWSLAVEEQFYIFYPLFLFLVSRYFNKRYAVAIGGVLLASFVWSVWRISTSPSEVFYLAPGRAWELMIGGFLAIGVIPELRRAGPAHALGLLGLGLIGYSVFAFSDTTLFPGANALFPCVGAAMVIYSGAVAHSISARALSFRPIVFVGLISYSLYLWHWVILAFARYYLFRPLFRHEAAAAVVVALLAATLSWRLIENPFRGRGGIGTRSLLFSGAGMMAFLLASAGALAYFTNGLPSRFSAAVQTMDAGSDDIWSGWKSCQYRICRVGSPAESESFLLWGDSLAAALAPGMDHEALNLGRAGAVAYGAGCSPVLQLSNTSTFGDCAGFRNLALDYIATHHITNVFLHAHWRFQLEANPADFEKLLRFTLAELRRRGLNVVIIASVPEGKVNVPMALSRHFLSGSPKQVELRYSDFIRYQDAGLAALRSAADEYSIRIVYPHQILCDTSTCQVVKDGWPLYSDNLHLSTHGAMVLAPMLDGLLRQSRQ